MNSDRFTRRLAVESMFIDLQTCGRCLGTEDALDAVAAAARPAADTRGVRLEVTKTSVCLIDRMPRDVRESLSHHPAEVE